MQPNGDPIDADVVKKIVLSKSTYEFELRILSRLQGYGFRCIHNGAYIDPATNKLREFDIYGIKRSDHGNRAFVHHIAVECKRIDKDSPLVVLGSKIGAMPSVWQSPVYSLSGDNEDIYTRYHAQEFIGRSLEQIQRKVTEKKKGQGSEIRTDWSLNDSDIFSKMSQAISSATAVVRDRFTLPDKDCCETFTEVTPVLVVPDNSLWIVEFSNTGDIIGMPKSCASLRYFIDYTCEEHVTKRTNRNVDLKHMTICTESALVSTLEGSEINNLAQNYYFDPDYKTSRDRSK